MSCCRVKEIAILFMFHTNSYSSLHCYMAPKILQNASMYEAGIWPASHAATPAICKVEAILILSVSP